MVRHLSANCFTAVQGSFPNKVEYRIACIPRPTKQRYIFGHMVTIALLKMLWHTLSSMQTRKNNCESEKLSGRSLTEDTDAVLNHQSANHACGICISSTLIASHSCRGSSEYRTNSFHAARLDAIQDCDNRGTGAEWKGCMRHQTVNTLTNSFCLRSCFQGNRASIASRAALTSCIVYTIAQHNKSDTFAIEYVKVRFQDFDHHFKNRVSTLWMLNFKIAQKIQDFVLFLLVMNSIPSKSSIRLDLDCFYLYL